MRPGSDEPADGLNSKYPGKAASGSGEHDRHAAAGAATARDKWRADGKPASGTGTWQAGGALAQACFDTDSPTC